MVLASANLGCRCRINKVASDSPLAFRLMEMGLIEGAELQLVRRAPLGDPVQIRLGDYDLSLRNSEAALIDVDAC